MINILITLARDWREQEQKTSLIILKLCSFLLLLAKKKNDGNHRQLTTCQSDNQNPEAQLQSARQHK
jgi:hypothetical protein